MTFRLRASSLAALPVAALLAATPAAALRVTTWNVLDYRAGNVQTRQSSIRTVFGGLDTDVLIVQEIKDQQSADSLLLNVLRPTQPARVWKLGGFIAQTESAIFYDSLKVSVSNVSAVVTGGPRQVLQSVLRPNGYRSNAASFRLYSVHFKAGTPLASTTDSTTRRVECTSLRNTLNLAPAGTNMLMGGDTNFYGAWEGGYIRLTESQADNDGRLVDLLTMPGTWNSSAYALYHSQSPCASGCPAFFSGGGMDDRFDLVLGTSTLYDGAGLDVVPGNLPNGYGAYGNDGQHYNSDINGGGFNNAVGLPIATALRSSSDHLPVILTLQLPSKVASPSALAFGDVIVGAGVTSPLSVGNAAPVPGDELAYSLSAPAGFSAPAGTFTINAGAAANSHAVGLDASAPGAKAGALAIASNDPDTASKVVQLSARVLAHAVGSLDSSAVTTSGVLDFGTRAADEFRDSTTRVFNVGGDGLQARLLVSAATIVGGEGRFSLVGDFTPALIAGSGQSWGVRFDPTGATPDSTFDATLHFTVGDEALPGQGAPGTLSVALHARVAPATGVGVDDAAAVLRFARPRPNPARGGTELSFELAHESHVALGVYDLSGRRVASLVDGVLGPGPHTVRWNPPSATGRGAAAGLYFLRFRAGGVARVERLVVLP